jgi:hypothetical protein
MVDLHLFLGRRLTATPTTHTSHTATATATATAGVNGSGSGANSGANSGSGSGAGSGINGGSGSGSGNGESHYGRIPDDVLQADVETVRGMVRGDVELEGQLRTVKNAYKLYYKVRGSGWEWQRMVAVDRGGYCGHFETKHGMYRVCIGCGRVAVVKISYIFFHMLKLQIPQKHSFFDIF